MNNRVLNGQLGRSLCWFAPLIYCAVISFATLTSLAHFVYGLAPSLRSLSSLNSWIWVHAENAISGNDRVCCWQYKRALGLSICDLLSSGVDLCFMVQKRVTTEQQLGKKRKALLRDRIMCLCFDSVFMFWYVKRQNLSCLPFLFLEGVTDT